MELFNNHRKLFQLALGLFVFLTIVIAIKPALDNQTNNAPLPASVALSPDEEAGKEIYIANGCVACHSQQIRNIEMDKPYGDRPSIAADYANITRQGFFQNTATLMGTERTGPDLINVGNRQPSQAWHLLHLYQPRAVVDKSIMPAYSWLFEEKTFVTKNDVEIIIPEQYANKNSKKIVATKKALQLVAYLQSLKQAPLPDGKLPLEFLYKQPAKSTANNGSSKMLDGKALYIQHCQSCHQENGEGLKGAFPPLKGSPVVMGNDLDLFVNIIMQGYDPRPEYATMPPVGTNNNLSAEEITAIINHEKTSWGNNAKKVTTDEVKKIVDFVKLTVKK